MIAISLPLIFAPYAEVVADRAKALLPWDDDYASMFLRYGSRLRWWAICWDAIRTC